MHLERAAPATVDHTGDAAAARISVLVVTVVEGRLYDAVLTLRLAASIRPTCVGLHHLLMRLKQAPDVEKQGPIMDQR